MGDVGKGVVELPLAQRPVRPVGKAQGLVDPRMGELRRQGLVPHRVAEAAHHGGDLGVEQGRGNGAVQLVEDLDILARRVEDLEHLGIRHELQERRQLDALGQGIDDGGLVGPRDLDEAEPRPIGPFPHELGIDGDVIGLLEAPAEPGEGRRV